MQRPAGDDDTGSSIPPMYTPSQLRLLKIAVIAMGLILLVGFATVIGRIIYLVNQAPAPSQPSAVAAPPIGAPASLALPKGAVVRHIAISENRLAIYYEGPEGRGVRIVDLVAGGASVDVPIAEGR